MEGHGRLQKEREGREAPWNAMEPHGRKGDSGRTPWNLMEPHGRIERWEPGSWRKDVEPLRRNQTGVSRGRKTRREGERTGWKEPNRLQ